MSWINKELSRALRKHEQPRCPSCRNNLELSMMAQDVVFYVWDKDTQRFKRMEGHEPYHSNPQCATCGYPDRELRKAGKAARQLGLMY